MTLTLLILYLSTMTVAELRAGVALLPAGKRRNNLHEYLEKRVLPSFVGRVLPFDLACTSVYAQVLATARRAGSGIVTPVQAGIPVIDGGNLVQNVMTAIESVAQTLKQIEQYQTQLQQYENMLQNTMAPRPISGIRRSPRSTG